MKKAVKIDGARLEQAMPKDPASSTEDQEPTEYETKDHLDTILKAHEIMQNPTKMKHVHKLAGRHKNAIRGIQDIKDHYNSKYGAKGSDNLDNVSSKSKMENEGN